jgi:hypothetical protein
VIVVVEESTREATHRIEARQIEQPELCAPGRPDGLDPFDGGPAPVLVAASALPVGDSDLIRSIASRPFCSFLQARMTRAPLMASALAVSNPIPVLAPVTIATRPD